MFRLSSSYTSKMTSSRDTDVKPTRFITFFITFFTFLTFFHVFHVFHVFLYFLISFIMTF